MFESLAELIFRPVMGAMQGVVGLLWPSDDPVTHTLQRWCLATLLGFLATGILAFAAIKVGTLKWASLPAILSILLGIASGWLGSRIEQRESDKE